MREDRPLHPGDKGCEPLDRSSQDISAQSGEEALHDRLPARKWQPAGSDWAWFERDRFRDGASLVALGSEAVGTYVALGCLVGPRRVAPQGGLASRELLRELIYRMSRSKVEQALTALEEQGWILRRGEDPFRYTLLAAPKRVAAGTPGTTPSGATAVTARQPGNPHPAQPRARRKPSPSEPRCYQEGEFFWIDRRVLARRLTATHLAAYVLLAHRATGAQQVWYTQADLELHLGLSSKGAADILEKLRERGLLRIQRRVGTGPRTFAANAYTLLSLDPDLGPEGRSEAASRT